MPAPQLLWSYDDGDWVVLVLEAVDGHMPREPWDLSELSRVLHALEGLSEALTPSPVEALPIADDLAENFSSWRAIADQGGHADRFGTWVEENLSVLASLETSWDRSTIGETLVHADLRSDNILVTADEIRFVDWPYAVLGAPWVDGLLFLTAVAAGGTDPSSAWERFGPARHAAPEAVNSVLAAVAGDFLLQSTLPAPPMIPSLRSAQRVKGDAALRWLQSRIA